MQVLCSRCFAILGAVSSSAAAVRAAVYLCPSCIEVLRRAQDEAPRIVTPATQHREKLNPAQRQYLEERFGPERADGIIFAAEHGLPVFGKPLATMKGDE